MTVNEIANGLREKTVAAVVLGDEGTLLVQCGEKLTALDASLSPKYAASLMKVVAEAFEA